MKALSIRQPCVYAIIRQGQDTENRPWKCSHRGWIALHASAKPQHGSIFPRGIKPPNLDLLDYGAICGVARLVKIVSKSRSKWFEKPGRGVINYGWVLADVKRLRKPIKCKGMLGLWKIPPGALRSIKRQLPKIDFSHD